MSIFGALFTAPPLVAEEAGSGGGKGVGVEEAADGGVIVAGLEVVEAGFGIVVVATIADGVQEGRAGGVDDDAAIRVCYIGQLAPDVVLVGRNL